jgi:hypothetical protein
MNTNAAPAKSGVRKQISKMEITSGKFIIRHPIGQAIALLSMWHRQAAVDSTRLQGCLVAR